MLDSVLLTLTALVGACLAVWPLPTLRALQRAAVVWPEAHRRLQAHIIEHEALLAGTHPGPTDAGPKAAAAQSSPVAGAGVPLRRVLAEARRRMQYRLVAGAVLANLALQVGWGLGNCAAPGRGRA